MSLSQPFVCLFTVPKPFSGLAAIHQVNAIKSWRKLGESVDIILCGDEQGVDRTAQELGVRHHAAIARNEFGTPLINDAFEAATRESNAQLLCFVNTDIILMSDFLVGLRNVHVDRFVLCGRRWDLEVPKLLDFNAPDWEPDLRARVRASGVLHAPEAMDYFSFPRGLIRDMPAFAIGRTVWDNWLVFHARALGAPLIDATSAITIVHQNHEYGHIEGGVHGAWRGPEAQRNRALGSAMLFPFSIQDATYELTQDGLVPRRGRAEVVRRAQARVALALRTHPRARGFLRKILRAKSV